jgi:GH15 family glucan-1,4-alpha-glucosidase
MGGIGDLALLSDCRTAALVDGDGGVVWWPGPRFDGATAFAGILGAEGGHFTIRPAGGARTTTRAYLPGTLVLRTEHAAAGGTLRVTDALAFGAGERGHQIGLTAPGALIRVVEAVGGDVEAEVELVPRLDYGLAIPQLAREGGLIVTTGGPERLFLADGGALEAGEDRATGRLALREGERRGFVLHRVPGVLAAAPAPLDALAALEDAAAGWRSWFDAHDDFEGPYRDEVKLASLVVQGLTHQPSGAVVAAPSASLPEIPGGGENWDYRYAWLRDASLVARALLAATCSDEGRSYFRWMVRAALGCRHEDHVQIVFGVEGERHLDERELDHLEGFAGSRPVRIGNAAWRQRQHDVLGEVLDVALLVVEELGDELGEVTARFLCGLADRAARIWAEPDAGVWEERDRDRRHTFSAAMCWVALDRAVRLADGLGDGADPERWAAARDEIRAAVLEQAWCERRQAFAGLLGGDRLDAAVLLLPLMGLVEAGDERMRSTVRAIEDALGEDGLLRRVEGREAEGAFLPATFWLASCHALAGDAAAARACIDRALACANDVGLLSEMADPRTGEALGNTPQALSHVGLVTAARCLAEAEAKVAS